MGPVLSRDARSIIVVMSLTSASEERESTAVGPLVHDHDQTLGGNWLFVISKCLREALLWWMVWVVDEKVLLFAKYGSRCRRWPCTYRYAKLEVEQSAWIFCVIPWNLCWKLRVKRISREVGGVVVIKWFYARRGGIGKWSIEVKLNRFTSFTLRFQLSWIQKSDMVHVAMSDGYILGVSIIDQRQNKGTDTRQEVLIDLGLISKELAII